MNASGGQNLAHLAHYNEIMNAQHISSDSIKEKTLDSATQQPDGLQVSQKKLSEIGSPTIK